MASQYPFIKELVRKYIEDASKDKIQMLRLEMEALIEECIERENAEDED